MDIKDTTIKIPKDLKEKLIKLKEHPRETYYETIERLIKLQGEK